MEENIELKIRALIDKIRPFLINDGGNLEFIKYEDNIVYVQLLGACADCAMMDITLKDGIEELIKEISKYDQSIIIPNWIKKDK